MKAKRIPIILVLVALAVEAVSYFLLSDGPEDEEVLRYASARSVSSTGSVCVLSTVFTNLGKEAQSSLLGILSNQYATVYVGVDSVPEEDRLYVRPYTNAGDYTAAHALLVGRGEVVRTEGMFPPLCLSLAKIRGGERFYWYRNRREAWRQRITFVHENTFVVKDYFWLMGRWQSYRRPWAICTDFFGIRVVKTLPEWKRMSQQELDKASGVQPPPDESSSLNTNGLRQ